MAEKDEELKEAAPKKKGPSAKIIAVAVAVVAIAIAAGTYWYLNIKVPYDEAVASFESAVAGLEERNAELDQAIAELQKVMESEPLDSTTLDDASAAIGEAQGAKEEAPEMPSDTDEINAAASEVDSMGDYTAQLETISTAQNALQDSIDQLAQVTNPSEQFVIERLTGLDNITGVEAATEDNDPNGQLHKDGGYTSAVFFSSDLVDQSEVYVNEECTGIPSYGTDGGGCIEVYETVEDAKTRNEYLAAFDGTILSSGSHTVIGTCVVRTSDLLKASEQDELEAAIIESLTRLD